MKKTNLVFWVLTGVCLCISAYLGVYCADHAQSVFSEEYLQSVQAAAQPEPVRMDKGTQMTITYRYLFCAHEETVSTNAGVCGLAGKTQQELEEDAAVTVREFSQKHVRMLVEEPEYCTKHYIVKSDGGNIYVFKTNRRTGRSEIYLDVHLRESDVEKSQRERLKTGVVFERTSDINRYLNEIQN